MGASDYDTDFLARLTVKRLAELNKTRAKVDSLERSASIMTDYELERRKLDILSRMSGQYQALGPQLKDMGLFISELKSYLQSVSDADLLGDATLQGLTTEHCIGYAVRLLDIMADSSKYDTKGSYSVMELASSTLAMFSSRPSAVPVLAQAGAVAVMNKVLSQLFPSVVVINIANAFGNMADDLDIRLAFRANGGVGAMVRLLRPDVEAAVQTAAAAALSLLAARDIVIQDSVRYLGGIDLLVALLAADDAYLAEVARYCLVSLRRGNIKNQAEIITAMRANSALSRDIRKLEAASELLKFEDGTPSKSYNYAAASSVRSLIDDMDLKSLSRPKTADSYARAPMSSIVSPRAISPRPASPHHLTRSYDAVSLRSSTPTREYMSRDIATASVKDFTSLSLSQSGPIGDDWRLGSALVEVESELLRKKHLARFSTEEVCLLLEEMGFDRLDLRGFRVSKINGSDLIDMREDEMSIDMVLPRNKVRKLQALQASVRLFDRIATLPRQGRISEIELRLYLAGRGAGSHDVSKIMKLFRTLVQTDRFDFVTFWDFVTSYDWISQAFRIYGVPC